MKCMTNIPAGQSINDRKTIMNNRKEWVSLIVVFLVLC